MEDFAVTCPLVPDVSRLLSDSCSSPRSFGFSFLQTPPRDDALAVSLAFGSAKAWLPDFHRHSYGPCPAHGWRQRVGCSPCWANNLDWAYRWPFSSAWALGNCVAIAQVFPHGSLMLPRLSGSPSLIRGSSTGVPPAAIAHANTRSTSFT